jgi:glycosyltransferase involved in cell wall biosynthesis
MKVLTVTAIYPTPQQPEYGAFIRAQVESLSKAGVQMDVFVISGQNRKLMYLDGVRQLPQHIAKNYDVVHAHYSFSGFVARTQFKTPVVVSLMGSDLLGNVTDDGKMASYSWLLKWSAGVLSRTVDAVIVKSDEMAANVPVKTHVIPNGVDFRTFHPIDRSKARAALKLAQDKTYVLFAAKPKNTRKGFDVAEAAFNQVAKGDPYMELVIAHQETQERLALYFNACDVLLFPSLQEGSPNTVKQAMACNLPIIASDVGDISQLFANAARSVVCERNADAFANALRNLLQSRDRSNGREAIAHLGEAAVAKQVIGVYESVLRGQKR